MSMGRKGRFELIAWEGKEGLKVEYRKKKLRFKGSVWEGNVDWEEEYGKERKV